MSRNIGPKFKSEVDAVIYALRDATIGNVCPTRSMAKRKYFHSLVELILVAWPEVKNALSNVDQTGIPQNTSCIRIYK